MALSKIPSAGFQDNVKFRNIIINGDMSIAQRGTSATVSDGSNEGYNTLDRFYTNFNAGIGGAVDLTQDTTVPANQGFAKSLKIQCQTTSTSFSGNMNLQVYQVIEAQNLQYLSYGSSSPKNIVFSFWCKADNYTSPLSAIFRTIDGTVEYFVKSFTPTSTWQKFTFSVPGSTSATIDNDNGAGLRVGICLAGSTDNEAPDSTAWSTTRKDLTDTQGNFLSSTSNILYITGVQLEAGQTASEFEFLPFDINYRKCCRYYKQVGGNITTTVPEQIKNQYAGGTQSTFNNNVMFNLFDFNSVEMRASPTLGFSGDAFITNYSSNQRTVTSATTNNYSMVGITYSGTKLSNATSQGLNFNTGAKLTIDSEL